MGNLLSLKSPVRGECQIKVLYCIVLYLETEETERMCKKVMNIRGNQMTVQGNLRGGGGGSPLQDL